MPRQKFQLGDEALHVNTGAVGVITSVDTVDTGYYGHFGSRKYYLLKSPNGKIYGYSHDFQHHKLGVDDLL